jgi:hypothetical protein
MDAARVVNKSTSAFVLYAFVFLASLFFSGCRLYPHFREAHNPSVHHDATTNLRHLLVLSLSRAIFAR